mgnify:CR=1 FL=1|jgi:hypothetical protein|nr:MAG TPA: hypothetical protein [Caudoviricetes sp.]
MAKNRLGSKLKKQLKTKIKGKVYVLCYESDIYVAIENSLTDMWCTTIPVLQAKVSEQKMVTILAQIVITQYKEDILNKYFIK